MKKTLLVLSLSALALSSCKKEGCMNINAANYDVSAEKDDASCTFEGDVVFYYSQSTYLADIIPGGYSTLDYYVDGDIIGSLGVDNAWTGTGIPACTEASLMRVTLNMAGQESRLYTYEVKDNAGGTILYSGSQIINGNACNAIIMQ